MLILLKDFEELASMLVEHYKTKESLDYQNKNGDFALLYAVIRKNHKMVKKILEMGANPDLTNIYGLSPLWYAVYNNDKETFFQLIKYGKNFEVKSCGVNYRSFRPDSDMIYPTPLSPIQVAEDKDFYGMVYFLYCLGVKIETETLSKLKLKSSNFEDELKLALKENDQEKLNNIEDFKLLSKEINKPSSLKRQCRNYFSKKYDLDKLNQITESDFFPKSLKNLILLNQV